MCIFAVPMERRSGLHRLAVTGRDGFLVAAAMVLVLNLLDGVLTLGVTEAGVAVEANPLMDRPLASWGAVGFMAVKCALVSLGVLLLCRLRHHRLAAAAIGTSGLVYLLLLAQHARSMEAIARFVGASLGASQG